MVISQDTTKHAWMLNLPGSDPKQAAITNHLSQFIADIRSMADAAETLLNNPGPDPAHAALEAVRLTAQARDLSVTACEHIAYTAHQEPNRVSIPRLADMMSVSINTLRRRLPKVAQGVDREPFTEF